MINLIISATLPVYYLKIVKWVEETRVKREGSKKALATFFSKAVPFKYISLMISAFFYQVRGCIGPNKISSISDLVLSVEKIERVRLSVDGLHKLDVVEDSFFVGCTDVLRRASTPDSDWRVDQRVRPPKTLPTKSFSL